MTQSRRRALGGFLGAAISLRFGLARGAVTTPAAAERILVIGASGKLGSLVVQALAAAGYRVRALVRPGHESERRLDPSAEIAIGDLRDPETLRAALDGVDRIAFTASASAGGTGDNGPQNVDYGGVVNVVAASSPRLRQILLVSSASVTQPLHPHNMWKDILLWKLKGENHLRRSGIPYTIVRPCGMRDYPGGIEGIGLAQGDNFAFGYVVSRADIAAVCAAALATPEAIGTTFEAYNERAIPVGPIAPKFLALRTDLQLSASGSGTVAGS